MTKLSKLLFGQVTNRVHGRKILNVEFDYRTTLQVKVNSDDYHKLELGCYFFALYDPDTKHITKLASVHNAVSNQLDIAIANLDNATTDLISAMDRLDRHERDEALRAAGVVLTGFWTVFNGVQTINALFAWEPINAGIGVGLTAGAAVLTKLQYEALTDSQKVAADSLNLFKRQLAIYHASIRRYAPEEMRGDVTLAIPQFKGIASRLKRLFENVTASDLGTGNINWGHA